MMTRVFSTKSGRLMLLLLLLFFLSSCGTAERASEKGDASVSVSMTIPESDYSLSARAVNASAPEGVSSVTITIFASDMNTIDDVFNVSPGELISKSYLLPAGNGRTLAAKAYSGALGTGTLLYAGTETFNLSPGETAMIPVAMTTPATTTAASGWARSVGSTARDQLLAMSSTADGGFIAAGVTESLAQDSEVWVVKFDSAGAIEWQTLYGEAEISEIPAAVKETSDGSFILTGRTAPSFSNIFIMKLSSQGSLAWYMSYGSSSFDDSGLDIIENGAGNYVVTGELASGGAGSTDVVVLSVDPADGSLVTQKSYGNTATEKGVSIAELSGGGYIVAGYRDDGSGNDIWVLRLDASFGVVWEKGIGGPDDDLAVAVRALSDGSFVVAGSTDINAGGTDILVVGLTSAGDLAWAKTYGGSDNDLSRSLALTADGGLALLGTTNNYGTIYYLWVLRLTAAGDVSWQKSYGSASADLPGSIAVLTDGSLAIAGALGRSLTSYDGLLMKTDADGSISSCSLITDLATTASAVTFDATFTNTSTTPADLNLTSAPGITEGSVSLNATTQCGS